MKRFLLILSAICVVAIVFTVSCVRDPHYDIKFGTESTQVLKLTMEEAIENFEQSYLNSLSKRSDVQLDGMIPSDFTPLWESNTMEHYSSSSFMQVPVLTNQYLIIMDISQDKDNPRNISTARQELHIVKNFEYDMVMTTVKTILPLNGGSYDPHQSSNLKLYDAGAYRSELVIYQTLDGQRVAMQLIENGVETVHLFIGEDPEIYHSKLSQIYEALEGYQIIVQYSNPGITRSGFEFGGGGGSDSGGGSGGGGGGGGSGGKPKKCYECGVSFDPNAGNHICKIVVIACKYCGIKFNQGEDHVCPLQRCNMCKQMFSPWEGHSCPGQFCPICGTAPCRSACPTCGKSHCTTNHSGGGGGSTTDPSTSVSKSIFRNSNMTEANWQLLDRAMEKIIANCLGGELYSLLKEELKGKTLIIELDPNATSSKFQSGGKIIWGIQNGVRSNSLLHELIHAYQSYQETALTMELAGLNLELEAFYAEYMYVSKLPEYTSGNDWYDRYQEGGYLSFIKNMGMLLTPNGTPKEEVDPNDLEKKYKDALKSLSEFPNKTYATRAVDWFRDFNAGFKNIHKLAKKCK